MMGYRPALRWTGRSLAGPYGLETDRSLPARCEVLRRMSSRPFGPKGSSQLRPLG